MASNSSRFEASGHRSPSAMVKDRHRRPVRTSRRRRGRFLNIATRAAARRRCKWRWRGPLQHQLRLLGRQLAGLNGLYDARGQLLKRRCLTIQLRQRHTTCTNYPVSQGHGTQPLASSLRQRR